MAEYAKRLVFAFRLMCVKVCREEVWHEVGMKKMYALAALVAVLPACSKVGTKVNTAVATVSQQSVVNERVYNVRGLVRSVDGGGGPSRWSMRIFRGSCHL